MSRRHPFLLLVLARLRELMREPEVVFWVFLFPILLAVVFVQLRLVRKSSMYD